ncbi:unnamed protein product [Cyprideis torosa]|uniref:Uncharacterized protein n=1 Tax=Cyprideis torosa TaxID=163714 RepID=A0A7R8ZML1_9CRUS|nr:unnamed protein product [Cyprideis torosa]CAG0889081.1 unnamed protein product [Cyprideis torosa]
MAPVQWSLGFCAASGFSGTDDVGSIPADTQDSRFGWTRVAETSPSNEQEYVMACHRNVDGDEVRLGNIDQDGDEVHLGNIDQDGDEVRLGNVDQDGDEVRLGNVDQDGDEVRLGNIDQDGDEVRLGNVDQDGDENLLKYVFRNFSTVANAT